jgi:hypothetical protein
LANISGHFEAQDAWVHFLMRRTSKDAFKAPKDLVDEAAT